MTKKTIVISVIIAVVIVVSVAIYFVVKNNKPKNKTGVNKWVDMPKEITVFPLTLGSKGKAVEIAQTKFDITVDGVFGTQTQGSTLSYYGSSVPSISKEKFAELLTVDNGDVESFETYYADQESYYYQFATIMAGKEIPIMTYQDYIALAQKVFGLQPSDFNF